MGRKRRNRSVSPMEVDLGCNNVGEQQHVTLSQTSRRSASPMEVDNNLNDVTREQQQLRTDPLPMDVDNNVGIEQLQPHNGNVDNSLVSSTASSPTAIEENETVLKCLDMYQRNKLSRDNVWNMSLIDSLSSLVDRHHKSLRNFKIAGSSLEASSKVYGLRVDSVHTNVMRMAAGLHARTFNEYLCDSETNISNVESNIAFAKSVSHEQRPQPAKTQRKRKWISTITKHKETLNAPLETSLSADPMMGKLNSKIGVIDHPTFRLLQNILPYRDSTLMTNMKCRFWNDNTVSAATDDELVPCEDLLNISCSDNLQLRGSELSGYVISDPLDKVPPESAEELRHTTSTAEAYFGRNAEPTVDMSLSYDMSASVESLLEISSPVTIIDNDVNDLQLTSEEFTNVKKMRGLQKASAWVDDLRPVNFCSELEYSYRPLEDIARYCVGPSHWKFQREALSRARTEKKRSRAAATTGRRVKVISKKMSKLDFTGSKEEEFIEIDEYKRRCSATNKWNQCVLKLPRNRGITTDIFKNIKFIDDETNESINDSRSTSCSSINTQHYDNDFEIEENNITNSEQELSSMDVSAVSSSESLQVLEAAKLSDAEEDGNDLDMLSSSTHTSRKEHEKSPNQMTRINMAFATRAKKINMKNLKQCTKNLIEEQLQRADEVSEYCELPQLPDGSKEEYTPGVASFEEVYKALPTVLSKTENESLSLSVAFYATLHLANDANFRLFQQDDLKDFKIRKIVTQENDKDPKE